MATGGDIPAAMARLTSGMFVMTSDFEGARAGVVVRSVQPCGVMPPLICVAARTGHWIEPIIRDSRHFAVCKVDESDRLILRKFGEDVGENESATQFDSFVLEKMTSTSPVLAKSPLVFDCEVVRHFDLEADHELYVGLVQAVRVRAR